MKIRPRIFHVPLAKRKERAWPCPLDYKSGAAWWVPSLTVEGMASGKFGIGNVATLFYPASKFAKNNFRRASSLRFRYFLESKTNKKTSGTTSQYLIIFLNNSMTKTWSIKLRLMPVACDWEVKESLGNIQLSNILKTTLRKSAACIFKNMIITTSQVGMQWLLRTAPRPDTQHLAFRSLKLSLT